MKVYLEHRWGAVGRIATNMVMVALLAVAVWNTSTTRRNSDDLRTQQVAFIKEQKRVDLLFAQALERGCSQSNQAKTVVRDLVQAAKMATEQAPLRPGQSAADKAQSIEFFRVRLKAVADSITNCKNYVKAAQGKTGSG